MKKRALILLTLLALIAIGITAQEFGRRMMVNYGGKVIGVYNLPQNIDSLTFSKYNIYTIIANSSEATMGSVTLSSNKVEQDSSVTLAATPATGCVFVNWTVKGEEVSTENPYTATVTANTEFVANFEEGELEYCTFSGNSKHPDRRLQSFTLTDGVTDAAVQNVQPAFKSAVYKDMTSTVFETLPGATITFKALDWMGTWMHGYVFIDYTKDGVFNNTLNSNGQTRGELVSYSFYSPTDSSTGTNSKGESVGNNGGISTTSMPSWVIPTDLAAGDYRFRFKGDWNSIDPCGITGYNNNTASNGGFMVDITIRVINVAARTISVSVNPEETGTVTINGKAVSSLTSEGGITLVATPAEGYEFVNWTVNGVEVSTNKAIYDITEGDKEYVATFRECKHNGHEYVDLGLPSGLKWATCNVGANSPEEYGDYFAWGETEPKDEYSWSTYKWCNGTATSITKYCTDSYYGTIDNKTILELEDDAAHVNWGGDWRMPAKAEQDELRRTNNCTWKWTTQNGVKGYKVTSVVNGNSIFLPAAGFYGGVDLSHADNFAYYWSSSSLSTYACDVACNLGFGSSKVDWSDFYRYYGQSVRAVCE